jgi:hypothetical protein
LIARKDVEIEQALSSAIERRRMRAIRGCAPG